MLSVRPSEVNNMLFDYAPSRISLLSTTIVNSHFDLVIISFVTLQPPPTEA